MKKKQILIEKYIEPSEILGKGGYYIIKRWLDKYEELHSLFDHPSYILYKDGKITDKIWHKKGIIQRGRNLPAIIWYKENNTIHKEWYRNGTFINQEDSKNEN